MKPTMVQFLIFLQSACGCLTAASIWCVANQIFSARWGLSLTAIFIVCSMIAGAILDDHYVKRMEQFEKRLKELEMK